MGEGTDVAREASDMILADDNFATIVYAVREGRVVWDNLRKVLLVNTPINNAQGMSVLFGLLFSLGSPLNAIQILYSNLICAVTLGFVTAIEPAEEGIMDIPPRRVGKRLIGRFLFLRIALGTFALIFTILLSVAWCRNENPHNQPGGLFPIRDNDVVFIKKDGDLYQMVNGTNPTTYNTTNQAAFDAFTDNENEKLRTLQSIAFNTLDLGAIAICLSARFSYNYSIHPRIFTGNKYCWYSILLVLALQILITYVPGLNDVIFIMNPMTWSMWGISIAGMCITFVIMEIEKAIRNHLKAKG